MDISSKREHHELEEKENTHEITCFHVFLSVLDYRAFLRYPKLVNVFLYEMSGLTIYLYVSSALRFAVCLC